MSELAYSVDHEQEPQGHDDLEWCQRVDGVRHNRSSEGER